MQQKNGETYVSQADFDLLVEETGREKTLATRAFNKSLRFLSISNKDKDKKPLDIEGEVHIPLGGLVLLANLEDVSTLRYYGPKSHQLTRDMIDAAHRAYSDN